MSTLEAARQALRERQGPGARYDAPEAPARALAWARLGTANFARRLGELTDEQLYWPSRVAGWTRAELVADVAYHARALCRQLEAVNDGLPVPPMYQSPEEMLDDVILGGTLPPRALRHLFDHAAIHLDVVWRDLSGPAWQASAIDLAGNLRALGRTAFERAAVLWLGALELNNGTRRTDLPEDFRNAMQAGDPRLNLTASNRPVAPTRKSI